MSLQLARRIRHFLQREDGVTAVECALILAIVVIICFVALHPAHLPPSSRHVQVEGPLLAATDTVDP